MRDFLKHNPRYRVPGQSQNSCWGKPRVMPFESSYIEQTANGFKAGVSYKDTLPAGCYENAPWDNRDANQYYIVNYFYRTCRISILQFRQ